jgi:hypothetical protein
MPILLEMPRTEVQIPFALSGSSEEDQTRLIVKDTMTECGTCEFSGVVVFTCVPVMATATAAVPDPLQGVRGVVEAIKEARPLQSSQNLDALVRRAAASRGVPADIESWARDLGDKTGKLND